MHRDLLQKLNRFAVVHGAAPGPLQFALFFRRLVLIITRPHLTLSDALLLLLLLLLQTAQLRSRSAARV